jgi:hypothetical protein
LNSPVAGRAHRLLLLALRSSSSVFVLYDLAQEYLREIGIDAFAKIPVEISSSPSGPRISASLDRMLRKQGGWCGESGLGGR